MQLLVLDPSHATEIFSVPKRRIFALPKIVRYRNKSGLQYVIVHPILPAQSSQFVDRAGWQAKMASNELHDWMPWCNAHGPHSAV